MNWKGYLYHITLGVMVVILFVMTIHNCNQINTNTYSNFSKINNNDFTVTILTIVAGILAAFSAISIYSIFNANVDRERNEIKKQGSELEKIRDNLDNKAKNLNEFDVKIEAQINLLHYLYNLTSPFVKSGKKRIAIRNFDKIKNVNDNTKEIVKEYYLSIKENRIETSQRYFPELERLLLKWNMRED